MSILKVPAASCINPQIYEVDSYSPKEHHHRRLMALVRCTLPCAYPIPAPRRGVDANGEVAVVGIRAAFGSLLTRVIKLVCVIDAAQEARAR